jgi:hypothetical protein
MPLFQQLGLYKVTLAAAGHWRPTTVEGMPFTFMQPGVRLAMPDPQVDDDSGLRFVIACDVHPPLFAHPPVFVETVHLELRNMYAWPTVSAVPTVPTAHPPDLVVLNCMSTVQSSPRAGAAAVMAELLTGRFMVGTTTTAPPAALQFVRHCMEAAWENPHNSMEDVVAVRAAMRSMSSNSNWPSNV